VAYEKNHSVVLQALKYSRYSTDVVGLGSVRKNGVKDYLSRSGTGDGMVRWLWTEKINGKRPNGVVENECAAGYISRGRKGGCRNERTGVVGVRTAGGTLCRRR